MSQQHIAFVFPGQGSQTVGMGRDLYDRFPAAKAVFDEADEALGFRISELCFSGPEERLKQTEITQPAILTVSVAALRALEENGVQASFAAGHSLGEFSAYVAAGTLTFADAVRTVHLRGRFQQEAVPQGEGAMAAVLGLSAEQVATACAQASSETGQVVSAANINSPAQIVISGTAAAVDRASALCREAGAKRTVPLPVSAPFHCALMDPAAGRLAAELDRIKLSDPRIPVASNVDAKLVTTAAEARDGLIRQVSGSVRWTDCIATLRSAGATTFIELGPEKVLTGLLRQIDRELTGLNVEDGASLEKTVEALRTPVA